MANLETAYELSGLADYLLASPGLVPVEGWPYEKMFKGLTDDAHWDLKPNARALDAGERILKALKAHYKIEANRKPHDEVPYSLLSTKSAVPVVEALGNLLGKNRPSVDVAEARLRSALEDAADKVGDPALADLGRMACRQAGFRRRVPRARRRTPSTSSSRRSGMPSPRTLLPVRLSRPPGLEESPQPPLGSSSTTPGRTSAE